jgi:hypothetical protein
MMIRSPLYDRAAWSIRATAGATPASVTQSSFVPAGIILTGPTPAEEATR